MQAGGFKTPFFALGLTVILVGLWATYALPANKTTRGRDYGTFRTYIRIPGVLVTLLSVFTVTFGLGFIDASFSAHLRKVSHVSSSKKKFFSSPQTPLIPPPSPPEGGRLTPSGGGFTP